MGLTRSEAALSEGSGLGQTVTAEGSAVRRGGRGPPTLPRAGGVRLLLRGDLLNRKQYFVYKVSCRVNMVVKAEGPL